MLTAEGCAARRERLWEALPSPCDVLVVADPAHLTYFAGYSPSPFVFRTVESGAVLLLEPGRATLVADDMMGPFVERAFVDERVAPVWYDGRHSAPFRRGQLVASTLARLASMPGRRLGVELASAPAGVIEGVRAARPRLEIVDIGPLVRPLRRAKHADEIDLLRASMRAGEAGLAAALDKARPGMTELDVYLIVQNAAMTELGEQVIVYGDFASGPRCAREKGGSPTSRTIEPGDLLLLDFSVIVSGYRGDFTNTFAVGGGPTPEQRDAVRGMLSVRSARARPRSRPVRPLATSTPPFVVISRHWGSTSISRRTPATGWASGTPSRPISSRRAAIRSKPATWSPSSPACMSREPAGCATSGIT